MLDSLEDGLHLESRLRLFSQHFDCSPDHVRLAPPAAEYQALQQPLRFRIQSHTRRHSYYTIVVRFSVSISQGRKLDRSATVSTFLISPALRTFVLISNPTSGRGRGEVVAQRVARVLRESGYAVRDERTAAAGDAARLAALRTIAATFRKVALAA